MSKRKIRSWFVVLNGFLVVLSLMLFWLLLPVREPVPAVPAIPAIVRPSPAEAEKTVPWTREASPVGDLLLGHKPQPDPPAPHSTHRGGKVFITATVGCSGIVKSVRIGRREIDISPLGSCLKARTKQMVFPAFSGSDAEIQVPLILTASVP